MRHRSVVVPAVFADTLTQSTEVGFDADAGESRSGSVWTTDSAVVTGRFAARVDAAFAVDASESRRTDASEAAIIDGTGDTDGAMKTWIPGTGFTSCISATTAGRSWHK